MTSATNQERQQMLPAKLRPPTFRVFVGIAAVEATLFAAVIAGWDSLPDWAWLAIFAVGVGICIALMSPTCAAAYRRRVARTIITDRTARG